MALRQASRPGDRPVRAIHFHADPRLASQTRFARMAFRLRWNRWNGCKILQLVIDEVAGA
jgi:hypothetical protein